MSREPFQPGVIYAPFDLLVINNPVKGCMGMGALYILL